MYTPYLNNVNYYIGTLLDFVTVHFFLNYGTNGYFDSDIGISICINDFCVVTWCFQLGC